MTLCDTLLSLAVAVGLIIQDKVGQSVMCAGELAGSSSSSSFLGSDEGQATSSSSSSMDLAMATFPLSFLVSNCSALQGLDQQVSHRGVGMGGGRGGLLSMWREGGLVGRVYVEVRGINGEQVACTS